MANKKMFSLLLVAGIVFPFLSGCSMFGSSQSESATQSEEESVLLDSIEVLNPKTIYNVNEQFVKPSVIAFYDDGSTKNVTTNSIFSGYNLALEGLYTVNVEYTENLITKNASYEIYVQGLESEESEESEIQTCIVDFDTHSDTYIPSVTVNYGELVTKPVDPVKEKYVFSHWDYMGAKWNFDTDVVTRNMTLHAIYVDETYVVTFDTDGGTHIPSVKVKVGELVEKPADPIKTGYTFTHWEYMGEAWDFDTDVVTKDITLYAKYTLENTLVISGSSWQTEWLSATLADFNAKRISEGKAKVGFEIQNYEENEIDSKVTDWDLGPDVYAFSSDKIMTLFQHGALATIPNKAVTEYQTTMKDGAMDLYAKFANKYVAYPFDLSNGYFLYYDKSVLTETDVQTVEGILAKCNENQQFAYNLEEAFYGIGALFTYGSRFSITTNPAGVTTEITADFNTNNGLKAAKAVVDILRNPYRIRTQVAPTPANKVIATIDGTWNATSYRNQMGENYACAKLPTVTVGGETATLGSFLGSKMYGVNPNRSSNDAERLALAHEVAQYLVSEEVQISRHAEFGSGPTLKSVIESEAVQNDEALVAINAQSDYAVAQTAVPGNVWSAPNAFYAEINEMLGENKDGTITDARLKDLLEVLNDEIIGSGW